MAWEIEFTDQFDEWVAGLSRGEQRTVIAAVDELEGPALALAVPSSTRSRAATTRI